jgi:hypothetical protein
MAEKRPPSITGSPLLDLTLEVEGSRAWRVFWATVGKSTSRRGAAKPAWDALDPLLLPDDIFRDTFDVLTECINEERTRRRAPTLVPTPASPDAETLVPGAALSTSTENDEKASVSRAKPRATARVEREKPSPQTNFFVQKAVEVEVAVAAASAATTTSAHQLMLPSVAEPERVAPTLWLRSAIFGVVERGARSNVFEKTLPTPWVKGELLFSGPELDQSDLDVMLQAIHMASSQGVVERPLVFSDKAMLQALQKTYSSGNREWLRATLSRLTSSKITIREDGDTRGREFHFLREQAWDNGRRAVVVTESAVRLFADEAYTVLQWKARLSLPTSLAKWLHGFLMSQPTTTNGVGLKILKDLSGVPASRPMKKFKYDLKQALAVIQGLDDPHLGLVDVDVVKGKDGPKLVWSRRPNRRRALVE